MECGEENALRHAAAPEISPSLKDGNDRGEELVMRDERIGDSCNSVKAKVCEVDEDGDLVLTRRRVWRAELVLADFVLHMMHKSSLVMELLLLNLALVLVKTIKFLLLSLGNPLVMFANWLVGMLLARVANTVFITDHGEEVLGNCVKNIHLNAGIFHQKASVYVRELDWNHQWPPSVIENSPSGQSYGWSVSEVEELHKASLLLAADVIYSDDLTDAFFRVLEAIMSNIPEKVLYLALEKRYNFTIDDLDVVANGYSHFHSYLKDWEEAADLETERSCSFTGQLINLEEIPQISVDMYAKVTDFASLEQELDCGCHMQTTES
ncbi:Methyltransferase-like protein 22 [Sesamum angolense]|uniref:Methyltransferase-like protein 22 n=1 Tax=Sesamum angolense TaxID=2727404 RepID=A0AAE1VV59_9LAMI|nr:Methyltransferase-like protein 22 [Sesamum angolense]